MPNPDASPNHEAERAAMRAFLQRCEVRLSTMHRVATALLSGAGLLVLLPAVQRDAVLTVLRSLLHGPLTPSRLSLAGAVIMSLVLAVTLLWLVIMQLTRFYFHAHHITHNGVEAFSPRFTLTSLRLPRDELSAGSQILYDEIRTQPHNIQLLVPNNSTERSRIDQRLASYPSLTTSAGSDDIHRADALMELASAKQRSLLDEVVKIEYGMARHVLRLQVVVLRYVKALLVVAGTVLATYISAAAADPVNLTVSGQRWIAATMAVWAPMSISIVGAPLRWLAHTLRAEGATDATVGRDPELRQVEDLTTWMGWLSCFLSLPVLIGLAIQQPISLVGRISSGLVATASVLLMWRSATHFAARSTARGTENSS